jgi:hypothetical protein
VQVCFADDRIGTAKAFNEAMTNRGFVACRKGHDRTRAFEGVRLKIDANWNNANKPMD